MAVPPLLPAPGHKVEPLLPVEVALPGLVGVLMAGPWRRGALVLELAREWLGRRAGFAG